MTTPARYIVQRNVEVDKQRIFGRIPNGDHFRVVHFAKRPKLGQQKNQQDAQREHAAYTMTEETARNYNSLLSSSSQHSRRPPSERSRVAAPQTSPSAWNTASTNCEDVSLSVRP